MGNPDWILSGDVAEQICRVLGVERSGLRRLTVELSMDNPVVVIEERFKERSHVEQSTIPDTLRDMTAKNLDGTHAGRVNLRG